MYLYVHAHVCIYVCACMYLCMWVCIYVSVYACMGIWMYIYVCMCIYYAFLIFSFYTNLIVYFCDYLSCIFEKVVPIEIKTNQFFLRYNLFFIF